MATACLGEMISKHRKQVWKPDANFAVPAWGVRAEKAGNGEEVQGIFPVTIGNKKKHTAIVMIKLYKYSSVRLLYKKSWLFSTVRALWTLLTVLPILNTVRSQTRTD